MSEFVVDILEPPIPPPNRTIHEGWGETKESKRRGDAWEEYMQRYRSACRADMIKEGLL